MKDGVFEVVHAPAGYALEKNCAFVKKLCCWAIRSVRGEKIGVLGTEPLSEMFVCSVVG